jgi:hypothetical protein
MRADVRNLIRIAAASLALAGPAVAQDDSAQQIEDLARRVEELEAQSAADGARNQAGAMLADWARRVRVGGSANTGWYGGQQDSPFHNDNFEIWDARFFVDAELGEGVRVFDTQLVRNVGFSFEWDLVRLGRLGNNVGELYTDFQGIGGSSWASVQVGRFQLPVGESYLLYSKGYRNNPFITNVVGGPWYWDEGLKFYGADEKNRGGYVASIANGESSFNTDLNSDYLYTMKLFANPTDWLHVSVSGLYQGKVGSKGSAGASSLWLGESWARAFGSSSSVANTNHGVLVSDGPNQIDQTHYIGADAIFERPDQVRLWLGYGTWSIDQDGGTYDRRLHYWVAELLLYGGLVAPELKDFYLGFRAHGLGTYDEDEGYLLDFRYSGSLGYNMEAIDAYSTVIGWKMLEWVTLRTEYTHAEIDLVKGVDSAIRGASKPIDSWGVEVGIAF